MSSTYDKGTSQHASGIGSCRRRSSSQSPSHRPSKRLRGINDSKSPETSPGRSCNKRRLSVQGTKCQRRSSTLNFFKWPRRRHKSNAYDKMPESSDGHENQLSHGSSTNDLSASELVSTDASVEKSKEPTQRRSTFVSIVEGVKSIKTYLPGSRRKDSAAEDASHQLPWTGPSFDTNLFSVQPMPDIYDNPHEMNQVAYYNAAYAPYAREGMLRFANSSHENLEPGPSNYWQVDDYQSRQCCIVKPSKKSNPSLDRPIHGAFQHSGTPTPSTNADAGVTDEPHRWNRLRGWSPGPRNNRSISFLSVNQAGVLPPVDKTTGEESSSSSSPAAAFPTVFGDRSTNSSMALLHTLNNHSNGHTPSVRSVASSSLSPCWSMQAQRALSTSPSSPTMGPCQDPRTARSTCDLPLPSIVADPLPSAVTPGFAYHHSPSHDPHRPSHSAAQTYTALLAPRPMLRSHSPASNTTQRTVPDTEHEDEELALTRMSVLDDVLDEYDIDGEGRMSFEMESVMGRLECSGCCTDRGRARSRVLGEQEVDWEMDG